MSSGPDFFLFSPSKPAASSTGIAYDHEGRGSTVPAFPYVRTPSFRIQYSGQFSCLTFNPMKSLARWEPNLSQEGWKSIVTFSEILFL